MHIFITKDDNEENDEYQDAVENDDEKENEDQPNSETRLLTNPKTQNMSHSQPKHKEKTQLNPRKILLKKICKRYQGGINSSEQPMQITHRALQISWSICA